MEEGDKNALIQQRIKKMMENKKKLKQDHEQAKRMKSGAGDKHPDIDLEEDITKPQSSIRMRRPVSAFKADSAHTLSTPPQPKPDIDFKGLLTTVFEHGTKLSQFLNEYKLNPQRYHHSLQDNELFILSTVGKLKSYPQEKYSAVVERQCMARISRELKAKAQIKRCEQAERRISDKLEDRLRMLRQNDF